MNAATGPQMLNGQTREDQSMAPEVGASAPLASRRRPLPRVLLALTLFALAGAIWFTFGRDRNFIYDPLNSRVYICSATLKTFEHQLQPGEVEPIISPYTGKNTGYLAEMCYWTKNGKRKKTPTYVLLNEHLGRKEKTYCPECGREVVGHNPPPPENTPLE